MRGFLLVIFPLDTVTFLVCPNLVLTTRMDKPRRGVSAFVMTFAWSPILRISACARLDADNNDKMVNDAVSNKGLSFMVFTRLLIILVGINWVIQR